MLRAVKRPVNRLKGCCLFLNIFSWPKIILDNANA